MVWGSNNILLTPRMQQLWESCNDVADPHMATVALHTFGGMLLADNVKKMASNFFLGESTNGVAKDNVAD